MFIACYWNSSEMRVSFACNNEHLIQLHSLHMSQFVWQLRTQEIFRLCMSRVSIGLLLFKQCCLNLKVSACFHLKIKFIIWHLLSIGKCDHNLCEFTMFHSFIQFESMQISIQQFWFYYAILFLLQLRFVFIFVRDWLEMVLSIALHQSREWKGVMIFASLACFLVKLPNISNLHSKKTMSFDVTYSNVNSVYS